MKILISLVAVTFSECVCCDLEDAERYKQRLASERSSLQDRCEAKVSKTVENVKKEFSRAIGDVIRQFAGERETDREEREEGERERETERERFSEREPERGELRAGSF